MSKLSFRARALDASKPMPIYKSEELPDLPDFSAINRAVPQMPSGMEKEEESEHHLQRAISAQQVYGSANHLVIPTPDCKFINKENYEQVYEGTFKQPRQYIHVQTFGMEQETPDYDMDSDDEEWVKKQAKTFDITSHQFEEMMDRLEKGSGQTVVNLKEAKLLLKEDDDLIIAVYDYWLNKRLSTGHGLIPTVKQEKRDGSTTSNPYVAFRRRTEKMQTRKNRKNDEASYEKMLKLRRDLNRAVTLLEMVKRREKYKKEKLHLTIEVFEKRYTTQDFSGELLRECEELAKKQPSYSIPIIPNGNHYKSWGQTEDGVRKKREYKKRKHKVSTDKQRQRNMLPMFNDLDPRFRDYRLSDEDISPVQSISDQEEENDPDGPFAFRRRKGCNYHAPHPRLVSGWPWSNQHIKDISDKRYRYCCTSLKVKDTSKCIGFARRRMGRGGRIVLDRAYTGVDDQLRKMDTSVFNPEIKQPSSWQQSVSLSTHSLDDRGRYRGASQSSTWPSPTESLPPLERIIADIRASRMPHYRPKTPPPKEVLNLDPPKPTVLEDNLLTNFLTQASSKPPQQILSDMDTCEELASTLSKDKVITDVDSQTIEVDVGSPTSYNMNGCFSTLPTSKFTLEPSSCANSVTVPVVEQVPLLVQPESSLNSRTSNEIENKNNSRVTLEPVVEVTGRGPILATQGHSTAPAATVLQLNYPLPTAVKIPQHSNQHITSESKHTVTSSGTNSLVNNSIELTSKTKTNNDSIADEAIKPGLNLKMVSSVNSIVNKPQSMPSSTVVRFTSSSSKIGSLSSNHDGAGGLGNPVKQEKALVTEVT
ncbi:enhancer of polycomb homolog 1-like [Anneissia japonica]|uniref:enhancer of polycomb homolog 1-like n=1 Tax=Anneissia japonica TaxID=1529436 RepID=UPI0014257627|nr:enhancer of polycomb homolog 1-like [Anneissia japonica]